jgi:cysteine-rich repeat protein
MSRSWLIGVSVVAHAAVGVGLFASGVWKIDRVEARAMPTLLSVAPPPPPPASGQLAGAVKPDAPKPRRERPRVLIQPVPQVPEAVPTTGTGGHTTTDGPEIDTPCVEGCGPATPEISAPVCGNGARETGEQCDDGNTAPGDGCSATCALEPAPRPRLATVAPSVLSALRISGETQIQPSSSTQSQMLRDGADRVRGSVKLCIGTDGAITSTALVASTKYADYDDHLLAAVRSWRYQPYTVNGAAVPACSIVSFIFTPR